MSSLRLSVPGKSFIAGEYLALKEGPCLVFASRPRFELLCSPGAGGLKGIHPDSPAGKLVADNSAYFKNFDLEFNDPHQGRGGWGASTAQFLTVFVLNEWRDSCELETLKSLRISRLLDSYYQFAWDGQGLRPSGADLVAQYKGSLTLFEKQAGLINVYKWPFSDIDFALISTGEKLATHEHLRGLGDFNAAGLESSMKILKQALQAGSSEDFVAGVLAAGDSLRGLGFVAPKTAELLARLSEIPSVRAVKGCGALGADVVLAVFDRGQRAAFEASVASLGLRVSATSEDLSHGLEIQVRSAL